MSNRANNAAACLALLVAACQLSACQSEDVSKSDQKLAETSSTPSQADAAPPAADNVPEKATAAEIAAARGDSPGKPVPPIRIDYAVLGEPRPGEPLEVELKVGTALEGPVTVRLQPREGLQMGAAQEAELRRETVGALAEPAAERVTVIPSGEGRFYLSVLVSVATPDGEQLRSVSVPIQVGDKPPTLKPGGELTTTEGETVISLPAKEPGSD